MQQFAKGRMTVVDPVEYRVMRQLRSAFAGRKTLGACKVNCKIISDLVHSCEISEHAKSHNFFEAKVVAARRETEGSHVDCLAADRPAQPGYDELSAPRVR